jgi:transcriptional regulator with XRE-family HTH domain
MHQDATGRHKPQGSAVLRSRLEHGLTLRQLADECEAAGTSVHYSTLSRIEGGEIVPRPALLATLAKVLDLDVAELERRAS